MNVFHIPSWYPHRCFPLEGGYVRELAVATAELRSDWNVALSLWGQGRGFVSVGHALHSPICLWDALTRRRPSVAKPMPNLTEFTRPVATWTHRILGGNREALLRVNRSSLSAFETTAGRVDLIHAHVSYPGGWVARRLREETGIPYVVTEHMGPFPLPVYAERDGRLPPFIRRPLEAADAVIAVSPALADAIAAHGLPEPEVVPNPVDERRYRVTPPAGDGFTFFTLCGMERIKAVDDLLHGIAAFVEPLDPRERGRVRFRMGGEGPMLGEYRRLAATLGLDDCVSWLGLLTREQAREEFMRCDAFVLTSRHESFGIVFVEAMACGRPAIATRSGGPSSIVEPATGILIEPGDRQAIAAALRDLALGLRRFDPRHIRATFERRFSRAAVVDRLEDVYTRALARRTSR